MMRAVSLVTAAAVTLSAAVAFAGTKFQGNIVPLSTTPPTLLNSSQFQFKGTGAILVKGKKVTDAVGLVTTTGTTPDAEYVAVVKGATAGISFQVSILVPLKKGNGTVKLSLAPLLTLAVPGSPVAITGVDFHSPVPDVGTNVADCTAVLGAAIPGVTLDPNPNPCATGAVIGVGGVAAGI